MIWQPIIFENWLYEDTMLQLVTSITNCTLHDILHANLLDNLAINPVCPPL